MFINYDRIDYLLNICLSYPHIEFCVRRTLLPESNECKPGPLNTQVNLWPVEYITFPYY